MKKYFGIVVVIIVLGGVWFGVSRSKNTSTKTVTTNTNTAVSVPQNDQEVVMTDFVFTPKEFTTSASQTIKVLLNNKGASAHSFAFDKLDFSSGTIEPGQSKVVTFTTPSTTGRYDFHCAQVDHKDKGMVGTMVVQ